MKIAIFFILIVTGAVASSVTEESSNRIVKDSNLRGSVFIVERAFQEQLEEKRDGNEKFMKDNEYAVQKAEDTKGIPYVCYCNSNNVLCCFIGDCIGPNSPNHGPCFPSVELMKDEEEDMAHDVSVELVKDNEYAVQKAEEAKDLHLEPQGTEEFVSYDDYFPVCFCPNCCFGKPNDLHFVCFCPPCCLHEG
jgi:hypothetical protein